MLSNTLQNQALLLSLGSHIHLLTSDKMPRGCTVGTMLIHHTSFASLCKFLCHPTGLCEHQQSDHRSCIWGLMIVLKGMDCGSMSWFWQGQNLLPLFLSLFHSFIFFTFPSLQSPSLSVALLKDFSLLWTQNPIMILNKKRRSMREMKDAKLHRERARERERERTQCWNSWEEKESLGLLAERHKPHNKGRQRAGWEDREKEKDPYIPADFLLSSSSPPFSSKLKL
jgi:hypothetical protein